VERRVSLLRRESARELKQLQCARYHLDRPPLSFGCALTALCATCPHRSWPCIAPIMEKGAIDPWGREGDLTLIDLRRPHLATSSLIVATTPTLWGGHRDGRSRLRSTIESRPRRGLVRLLMVHGPGSLRGR
jgi:hypothetical protein